MDGRQRRAAVDRCLDASRAIAGCVTDQPLRAIGANRTAELPASLSFLPLFSAAPVRRSDGVRLGFAFRFDVSTEVHSEGGVYRVEPVSYSYQIRDRSGHELVAYHWHPNGLSRVLHPHMHLSSRIRPIPLEPDDGHLNIAGVHLPTRSMSLADIVRFLIAEVGVEPRRPDWDEILAANDA